MTLLTVLALLLASAEPPAGEIHAAIEAGRLIQARAMLEKAGPAPELRMLAADLALAERRDEAALAAYRALLNAGDARAAEGAGIAALRLGDSEAEALLRRATAQAPGSWRAWNALGVAMDRGRRWAEADAAYAKALQLRPGDAPILSNHGYSLILQRRFKEADAVLSQAAAAAPDDPVIRANRDIVDVLIGRFSGDKPGGISRVEWARRLNNAGYVASISGDRVAAIGLLTRSIITSDAYYARAANNLAQAQGAE